ncbi:Serine/threonine protein kinase [Planctomycetales bacterium 10988]|nr:Serine/threonine protein kinase [Planctomycetales bacterium 10988]
MNVGDIVDEKYQLESEIGQGSFGTVFLAKQVQIDRTVALKVLLPWVKADQAMRHRFRREAKLASVLRNEHTIDIFDFGETSEGDLYIVMEYLEGAPLDVVLKEEVSMNPSRVKHIALQTLHSLQEAHDKGIVHRDLKPDNIFLCNNALQKDFVKVFDFGIAKIVGGGQGALKETTKLTVTGGTVGTPVYMSPEQCRGQDLSPASDIYSLGIVLYECLTGTVPFEDSNPVQTMMMHNNAEVPPLPDELASTEVGKAIMKSLNKKISDRFATADAFAAALKGEQIPEEKPGASVTHPNESSRTPVETGSGSSSTSRPSPVSGSSQPAAQIAGIPLWAALLGVLVLGVFIGVGVFLILQK